MIEVPELYVTVQILQNISNKLNIRNWATINRTSCDSAQWKINGNEIESNVTCNCTFENGSVCHVTRMYACFLYRKYSRIVILPLAKAMRFIYIIFIINLMFCERVEYSSWIRSPSLCMVTFSFLFIY
jgi:hypothetical protein